MKLKNIFGAMLCTSVIACSATAVFAAGETFEIGKPIDLETNAEVDELTVGQVVALPVDIITDQQIVSMGYATTINTDVLTPGAIDADLTDTQYDNASALGEIISHVTDSSKDMMIFSIGEEGRRGFESYGNPSASDTRFAWYDAEPRTINESTPEFYVIMTVNKAVSLDDLNVTLITPDEANTTVGVYQVGGILNATPNTAKANACYGAFNINIDSSVLPYWIQGLYVSLNGGEKVAVTEYKTTDNVNYTFPVRVTTNSTSAAKATVEVFADTTTDEAGTANVAQVSMGTFEIQLNSPTSYTDQAVSAQ